MLATPTFWLLYLMFVLISASGLMATAQIALIAKSYGISNEILFLGATTLTVALIFDNVMNGVARPFFGWVSDKIGREKHNGDRLRSRRRRLLAAGRRWAGTRGCSCCLPG